MKTTLTDAQREAYITKIAPLLTDECYQEARPFYSEIVEKTGSVREADIVWGAARKRAASPALVTTTTIAPLTRISLRRWSGRPISLIVVEVAAGMLICRDSHHTAGAFSAVLVIDPATAETGKGRTTTYRPLAGTEVYRTVPQAVAAALAA